MAFRFTKESEKIDLVMKNFKVRPYSEVSKTLDEAAQKTLLAHKKASEADASSVASQKRCSRKKTV